MADFSSPIWLPARSRARPKLLRHPQSDSGSLQGARLDITAGTGGFDPSFAWAIIAADREEGG
jgi:hypothetical protein